MTKEYSGDDRRKPQAGFWGVIHRILDMVTPTRIMKAAMEWSETCNKAKTWPSRLICNVGVAIGTLLAFALALVLLGIMTGLLLAILIQFGIIPIEFFTGLMSATPQTVATSFTKILVGAFGTVVLVGGFFTSWS